MKRGNTGRDVLIGRKNVRVGWHDYDEGAYFVTVCCENMRHSFGYVEDGVMHSNELGEYLNTTLSEFSIHCDYCYIPLWVVMPNHFHAIIVINGRNNDSNKSYLARIMTSIKSVVTRKAKSMDILFAWQRGYYEHIIRNMDEGKYIDYYIRTNPERWSMDRYNPDRRK